MSLTAPSFTVAAWKTLRAGKAFVTVEPVPQPPKRRLRRRARPVLWLGLLAAAAAAGGPALFALADGSPPVGPAPQAAASIRPGTPDWTEVLHPFMAYDLAGGPYARLPLHYTARRDRAGKAREDRLTYGAPQPGEAFLYVAFLRRGGEPEKPASVFLDAARLAAGAGLAVTRSGLATRLDTRFGPFEITGVAVERRSRSADCLAFRLADPASAPVLGLTGLACGTVEHPIDVVTLTCTLDRLDLVSAGDDEALRAVFVQAERRRRDTCAPRQPVELRLGNAGDRPGMRPLQEPL